MITDTQKELIEMGIWRGPMDVPYGQMHILEMTNSIVYLSNATPPAGGHKAMQHYASIAAHWVPLLEHYLEQHKDSSAHVRMRLHRLLQNARNGTC